MSRTGKVNWRWLIASSAVAGATIWSTHFVAMLAYQPSLQLGYEVGLTALSIAIAMVMTLVGFTIVIVLRSPMLGGAVFGAAVGSMHFTGMLALQAPATF
ncbi:MAG TPA: MHYT domain-containing protein, partial [Dongiaceae bacterium]